ncbi:Uncharacterised protein [uncultured archaeon]|nr:Uncharacterised protein [uncultured archaeon]
MKSHKLRVMSSEVVKQINNHKEPVCFSKNAKQSIIHPEKIPKITQEARSSPSGKHPIGEKPL